MFPYNLMVDVWALSIMTLLLMAGWVALRPLNFEDM